MTNKNKKLCLVALVVLLVALSGFLVIKKFHLFSSKTTQQNSAKTGNGPPKEQFIEVVPITFHVEKYLEIPLTDGDAYDPKVSPDGSRIVFIRKTGGKSSVAVAELPGGGIAPLDVAQDEVADPSWSADGTKIVFAGSKQGVWEIFLYDLKGKKLQQVTNDPKRKKSWPRFSPYKFDGNFRIAYVAEENGRKDIWWVRESGQYDQPITFPASRAKEFSSSPYWSEFSTGDAPRLITSGGDMPEWSPSGNLLLYRTAQGYALLAYNYETWWVEAKTSFPSGSGLLSWAPNQISFLDFDTRNGKAAIVPRDSLKRKAVLSGKELTSSPAFFPDGKGFACTVRKAGRSVLTIEPYADPMGDLANLWMYNYSRVQSDKMTKNQLLFLKGKDDQIYNLYDSERYGICGDVDTGAHARPYLVTSDAVLETFYAAFAALYAQVERTELSVALEEFARKGAEAAREKGAGKDVENFFLTGLGLLKKEALRSAPAEVQAEVGRVENAEGSGISFFGNELDYSDFYIRGKYERDKDLQGYFRAIKWFQAFTFDLDQDLQRKQAAGILGVAGTAKARPSLERIYAIYREMIGESRYYNPLNLKELPVTGQLPEFKSGLPWVAGKKAFRLLPSIYTLDAHVFDELIWHTERPESVQGRDLPMGLDIMAAFGSHEARRILLDELKQGQYPNYEQQLAKVTDKIGKLSRSDWGANIYQNWLDALASLVQEPDTKSPSFTKSAAWKRKQLNTALGSWVNLRYETIAVVEQVASECGEGGYETINIGKPRGYVEPNPEFFRRLDEGFGKVAIQLEKAISSPELKKGVADKIAVFRQHLKSLETIARKELDGVPLTDEEYSEILNIGGTVEHFIVLMGSLDSSKDQAVRNPEPIRKIVDLQKSADGVTRLYAALGFVNEVNVAVPFYGRRTIVKGPVYSYHEFTSEEALNSEKWRNSGKQAPPPWLRDYFEGNSNSSLKTLSDMK
jgi:Tol biopolymer transport system component